MLNETLAKDKFSMLRTLVFLQRAAEIETVKIMEELDKDLPELVGTEGINIDQEYGRTYIILDGRAYMPTLERIKDLLGEPTYLGGTTHGQSILLSYRPECLKSNHIRDANELLLMRFQEFVEKFHNEKNEKEERQEAKDNIENKAQIVMRRVKDVPE